MKWLKTFDILFKHKMFINLWFDSYVYLYVDSWIILWVGNQGTKSYSNSNAYIHTALYMYPIVTGGYSPIRGLIQEKNTIWIRCDFCFYNYWALVCQSQVFLKKNYNVDGMWLLVSMATVMHIPVRALVKVEATLFVKCGLFFLYNQPHNPVMKLYFIWLTKRILIVDLVSVGNTENFFGLR